MIELINYIQKLPGYKISDTHFRVGSKIHLEHFYFAKRMFQNSFFASRFALLLAKEINNIALRGDSHELNLKEDTTLIGYGLYSELLVSITEKLLIQLGFQNLNHNLITDTEKPEFIKGTIKTRKNILIIVPIGSTFTTALKIEEHIKQKLGAENHRILDTHFNILVISNSNSRQLEDIEKKFGWLEKDIDKKEVHISVFSGQNKDDNKRVQKFFLQLPATWQLVQDCKWCFPGDIKNERLLYITDPTSVTPTLIFDTPKVRDIPSNTQKFNLHSAHLKHGHLERDKIHYQFYIRVEYFFQNNKEKIEAWLKSIQNDLYTPEKAPINENDNVYILAPGHYSNTSFINYVNEIVFSGSATVIHFDTRNDYILNFKLYFGDAFSDKNTKVILLDDTLVTGGTLNHALLYLRHAAASINLVATIVLINRTNSFNHQNIINKLNGTNFYTFANLHLPSLKDIDGQCPLCVGLERLEKLEKVTYLDRLKLYFLEEQDIIKPQPVNTSWEPNHVERIEHKQDRYVLQIEIFHRIYQYFSGENVSRHTNFNEFLVDFYYKTSTPFDQSYIKNHNHSNTYLSDHGCAILIVMTHPPFIHYKPLRDIVFNWVLSLLTDKIESVKAEIEENKFVYESFRELKFLIRRAGLLNINLIISQPFIEFLYLLYGNNGLSKVKQGLEGLEDLKNSKTSENLFSNRDDDAKINEQIRNTEDFHLFFTAQIKELLFQNEARSIRLEKIIITVMQNNNYNHNKSFMRLLRFIREENGLLISNYWEFFNRESGIASENNISELLGSDQIYRHYRTQIIIEYLKLTQFSSSGNYEFIEDTKFIKYLDLMRYLNQKISPASDIQIEAKTATIVEKIQRLVEPELHMSGAFFLINYRPERDAFVAYNKCGNGTIADRALIENDILVELLTHHNNLSTALESKYALETINEFHRHENGRWDNLYRISDVGTINLDFIPLEYNRLVLIKFSEISLEKVGNDINSNKTLIEDKNSFHNKIKTRNQGVLGIYFKKEGLDLTEISTTRYLLLLREPISAFIRKHHENDEFRDWVELDKIRKLTLLAGHGRDMYMRLAKRTHSNNKSEGIFIDYHAVLVTHLKIQTMVALSNNLYSIGHDSQSTAVEFDKYYSVHENFTLKEDYLSRLHTMAINVFDFSEIENTEYVSVYSFVKDKINFPFSTKLLDMICLELLINAKKNRWHFFVEDCEQLTIQKLELKNGTEEISIDIIDKNIIQIELSEENEQLVVHISNTGPEIESRTINDIRKNLDPKGKDQISGLSLIFKLFSIFDLGKLFVNQKVLNNDTKLAWITTTLILNKKPFRQ